MTSDPIARYLSQRGAKFNRKNRLRIMSSSEVLDTALRVYQRLGLSFLRMTVAPALLCLASVGFVQNYVLPGLFLTKSNGSPLELVGDVSGALGMAVFVGGPLFLLGISYSSTLVVHLVSAYMTGRTPDPEQAAISARGLLPRMFVVSLKELCMATAGIVASTAIMGLGGYMSSVTPDSNAGAGIVAAVGVFGMLVGILWFLYVLACDALVAPIAVIEGLGARQAGKRSRELLKRAGYHPAGTGTIWSLYFLLAFISAVLSAGIYSFSEILNLPQRLAGLLSFIPGEQLFQRAFDLIPSFIVIWTLAPVWATVITIVYYERKIRLEGFDIDVLAAEIPTNRPQISPSV